jgi:hypothetical protein
MPGEKRGQSVFNTSEIERQKIKKNNKKIKIKTDFLSKVLINKTKLSLNKDVTEYISRILIKQRSSTSTKSSSHIKDPNNFNNFNKKKIIEFIKNRIQINNNNDNDNTQSHIFNLDHIREIENMNELILPFDDPTKFTVAQTIISLYYNFSIMNDMKYMNIKNDGVNVNRVYFNNVLNNSRFNIKKSDRKFFIYNHDFSSSSISDPYSSTDLKNNPYFNNTIINNMTSIGKFQQIFFLTNKIDNPHIFAIVLILIVRHIRFKEMLKESLYFLNGFKKYNIEFINEKRNQISINLSLRREENRFRHRLKIQRLLNLVENIFDKTFKKIIKELKN